MKYKAGHSYLSKQLGKYQESNICNNDYIWNLDRIE